MKKIKKNNILIYGAGGFGKTLFLTLEKYFNIVGFIDDTKKKNLKVIKNSKIIGNYESLKKIDKNIKIILAIGYKSWSKRSYLIKKIKKKGFKFQKFIDVNIKIPDSTIIEDGAIICKGSIISENSVIKENSFIDISCSIGENVIIGKNCYVSAASNICGNVTIGQNSFLGAGTIICDELNIGENCFINAGSLIHKNLDKNIKFIEKRNFYKI